MPTAMNVKGISDAARYIARTGRANHRHMLQTATYSKQPAYDELGEVWNNCQSADWDIHAAEPVERDALRNAYLFIEALPPGYPLPSIGSEPDGHLTLEWYRATNWLVSVSISPEGALYYAALLGDDDPRGTSRFDGEVPETILYLIRRVCEA